uniref:Uncharacterized protein n=1 Tax=Anguilla anguilla TaxID=7936 RepID=A0A0E9RAC8_ANGAN
MMLRILVSSLTLCREGFLKCVFKILPCVLELHCFQLPVVNVT